MSFVGSFCLTRLVHTSQTSSILHRIRDVNRPAAVLAGDAGTGLRDGNDSLTKLVAEFAREPQGLRA